MNNKNNKYFRNENNDITTSINNDNSLAYNMQAGDIHTKKKF